MKTAISDVSDAWKCLSFIPRLFFVLFTTSVLSHFILWLCVETHVVQARWLALPLLLTLVALAGGAVLIYQENQRTIAFIAALVLLAFFVRVGLLLALQYFVTPPLNMFLHVSAGFFRNKKRVLPRFLHKLVYISNQCSLKPKVTVV